MVGRCDVLGDDSYESGRLIRDLYRSSACVSLLYHYTMPVALRNGVAPADLAIYRFASPCLRYHSELDIDTSWRLPSYKSVFSVIFCPSRLYTTNINLHQHYANHDHQYETHSICQTISLSPTCSSPVYPKSSASCSRPAPSWWKRTKASPRQRDRCSSPGRG